MAQKGAVRIRDILSDEIGNVINRSAQMRGKGAKRVFEQAADVVQNINWEKVPKGLKVYATVFRKTFKRER